jgi:hypothetical protein
VRPRLGCYPAFQGHTHQPVRSTTPLHASSPLPDFLAHLPPPPFLHSLKRGNLCKFDLSKQLTSSGAASSTQMSPLSPTTTTACTCWTSLAPCFSTTGCSTSKTGQSDNSTAPDGADAPVPIQPLLSVILRRNGLLGFALRIQHMPEVAGVADVKWNILQRHHSRPYLSSSLHPPSRLALPRYDTDF